MRRPTAKRQVQEDHWLGCLALSILGGAVGYCSWPLGQKGADLFAALSAIAWLFALDNANRGLKAWDRMAAHRHARRRLLRKSDHHGKARFSTWKDLKGSTLNSRAGVFLGKLRSRFRSRRLYYGGENSALFVAGPGQGKSTTLIQTLLEDPTSMVILDPQLELFATTSRERARMGHRVWCLMPWWEDYAALFPNAVVRPWDDGFDFLAFLDPTRSSIIDDCWLVAAILLPKGEHAREIDDYFRDLAHEILVGFMLLELSRKGSVTILELRNHLLGPTDQLEAAIEEMEESEAFTGALAQIGARIAVPYISSEKEWAGGLGGAAAALRIYAPHGPLGQHVTRNGVDFSRFRSEPTTCYIGIPTDKTVTHASWCAAVVGLSIEMIARDHSNHNAVRIILEEFQHLPRLDKVLKGLALYRKTGLSFLIYVQFISALKRVYGESWKEFLGVEVFSFFGATSDPDTLELVSRLAGQETFRDSSYSNQPEEVLRDSLGLSTSIGERGRPLVTPADARMLQKGKQIIFAENLPPILATKESYLRVRRLRRKAESLRQRRAISECVGFVARPTPTPTTKGGRSD